MTIVAEDVADVSDGNLDEKGSRRLGQQYRSFANAGQGGGGGASEAG